MNRSIPIANTVQEHLGNGGSGMQRETGSTSVISRIPAIAVVTANHNGQDQLGSFLDSCICQHYPNLDIFIVDNCSRDRSEDIANRFPSVHFIKLERNMGATARNFGIKAALERGAEYVFVTDNDTIMMRSMLEKLVSLMEARPDVGSAAPMTISRLDETISGTCGSSVNRASGEIRIIGGERPALSGDFDAQGLTIEVDVVGASLIRTEVLTRVGMYDPVYFAYAEDQDLCARIRLAGLKIVVRRDALLWHSGSETTKRVVGFKSFFILRNRLVYLRKFHSTLTPLILPLLIPRWIVSEAGGEALRSGLSRFLKAFLFASLGAIEGLCYLLRGKDANLTGAKDNLLHELADYVTDISGPISAVSPEATPSKG